MARWFHIRNGSGAAACFWGTSTSTGQIQGSGDALIATNGDGRAEARFRFSSKDNEGRFTLETPTGHFATVNAAGDIVVGPSSPGDARQLWKWGQGGQLINGDSAQAAAFVSVPGGQKLTTRPPKTGEATQVWNVVASGPADNNPVALCNSWVADTVTIPDDPPVQVPGTSYQVAAINGANLGPGVAVVNATLAPSTQGQLWLCNATTDTTGTIVCAENPNLLLTATDAGAVYVAAPLVAPANPAYQQWSFSAQGALTNAATQGALTFGGSGEQLTVTAVNSSPGTNQTCGWTPGNPLDAILAQPTSGFPPWNNADQDAAYAYINNQLGVTDLRQQYTNADTTTLQNYKSDIDGYTWPSSVVTSEDDWNYVTGQLNAELQAVTSVQGLFSLYSGFNSEVFAAKSVVLSGLGNAMDASDSKVSGLLVTVIEGTLYTLLSALPGFGGIIGNLFQTGFNAAVAAGTISSTDLFQDVFSNLWDSLYPNFNTIESTLSGQETTIEQNWDMLQAVAPLISQQVGPDSLFWSTAYCATYQNTAIQGFSLGALQMLWPTKFYVARAGLSYGDVTPPSIFNKAPAGSSWWNFHSYFVGVDIFCVIVKAPSFTGTMNFPSSTVIEDFLGAGGQVSNFYPSLAGCSLTVYDGVVSPLISFGNWQLTLLATIVNMSEYPFNVMLAVQEGRIEGGDGTGKMTLPLGPYASVNLACDYVNGLRIAVSIVNQNTPGPQASCLLHMSHDLNIWVDTVKYEGAGFTLGEAIVVPAYQGAGGGWGFTSGGVTLPVFYVPS